MKKIILAISLAAIMLLCGCGADAGSAASLPSAIDNNSALIASLAERVQKNIDTKTLEGFNKESTFRDVAENANMEFSGACVTFAIDFLGFPANISSSYSPARGGMAFSVLADEWTGYEEKISNILNKLDNTLGSHTEKKSNDDSYDYDWQTDTYHVNMQTNAANLESAGWLGNISLDNQDKDLSPFDIPRIFYSLFGVEYTPEYGNKMQDILNNKQERTGHSLSYIEDGIHITFRFHQENNICGADYLFSTDKRDTESALDFMEACVDTFQNVFGKPNSCKYVLPNEDIVNTAAEMRQLGCDSFRLDAYWNAFGLHIYSFTNSISVHLYFPV